MRVESAPCVLRRLQELERHRQACDTGACALGHPRPQFHRGEGGLDRVRRPNMLPVGGEYPV